MRLVLDNSLGVLETGAVGRSLLQYQNKNR